MQKITNSDSQTRDFAAELTKKYLNNGGIIALIGDLGSGKTTFVQGFAQGLNITEKIISPTFVLHRIHQIPNTKMVLHHLDLYRLEKVDLHTLSEIKELFDEKNNIILIEWADKILEHLPKEALKITIEKISEQQRNMLLKKI